MHGKCEPAPRERQRFRSDQPRSIGAEEAGQAGTGGPATRKKGRMVEPPAPRVVSFVVGPADVRALDDLGGEPSLAERLEEAVEKHGLAQVLRRLEA